MSEAEIATASWWASLWTDIEHWAFLGVVVALAIEFVALRLALRHHKALENANELELAQLKATAAEANQKAEEERAARVKFESERAWRSLSREQHDEIAEKMRKFAGQRFRVLTYRDDRECDRFALQIAITLAAAGWIEDANLIGPMGADLRFIKFSISDDGHLEAVYALMDELRAVGHECACVGSNHAHPKVIEIRVGRKPERARL